MDKKALVNNNFMKVLRRFILFFFICISYSTANEKVYSNAVSQLFKTSSIVVEVILDNDIHLGYSKVGQNKPVSLEELNRVGNVKDALSYGEIRLITYKVKKTLKGDNLDGIKLNFIQNTTPLILHRKFKMNDYHMYISCSMRIGLKGDLKNKSFGLAISELISSDFPNVYHSQSNSLFDLKYFIE